LTTLPVHFSQALHPHLHLHQFQLLSRPLQTPPTAAQAGKRIKARQKSKAGRYEIHVPIDVRPEVWNADRGRAYGAARYEEDREEAAVHDIKLKDKEPEELRLSEVRLLSEKVAHRGEYVLGVVRDGRLHLHPIGETHQFRPSQTYLDVIARRTTARERRRDSDEESDGPPPDPDDPNPPAPVVKKAKKTGEIKEVQVTARKAEEKGGQQLFGGLSQIRREILSKMREEREEPWENLDWCDIETEESVDAFEQLFSKRTDVLTSTSKMTDIIDNVKGLR